MTHFTHHLKKIEFGCNSSNRSWAIRGVHSACFWAVSASFCWLFLWSSSLQNPQKHFLTLSTPKYSFQSPFHVASSKGSLGWAWVIRGRLWISLGQPNTMHTLCLNLLHAKIDWMPTCSSRHLYFPTYHWETWWTRWPHQPCHPGIWLGCQHLWSRLQAESMGQDSPSSVTASYPASWHFTCPTISINGFESPNLSGYSGSSWKSTRISAQWASRLTIQACPCGAKKSYITELGVAWLFRDNVWILHGLPYKVFSEQGNQFISTPHTVSVNHWGLALQHPQPTTHQMMAKQNMSNRRQNNSWDSFESVPGWLVWMVGKSWIFPQQLNPWHAHPHSCLTPDRITN